MGPQALPCEELKGTEAQLPAEGRWDVLKLRASPSHPCWLQPEVESQVFIANGQTSCSLRRGEKNYVALLALRGFVRIRCLAVAGT